MIAQPGDFALQASVLAQQFVRIVADLLSDMRVLAVQVPITSLQFCNADLPGELIFHPLGEAIGLTAPPGFFHGELFDTHGLGLGVALVASRVLVLVEPHVLGRRALGKEQQVGPDSGVRIEHTVGQSNDGVQVALGEQLFLDAALDAFAEQEAIG
ncbi:hypothetical protein D9M69_428610 [compost metagenome]